jgi:hypothetical protein
MKTSDEDSACWFIDTGCEFVCESCGRVVVKGGDTLAGLPFFACHPRRSLGDMVAAGLSAIGVTKERVSAVVGGDCGCHKRQEALNQLGRKIGIG